MNKKLVAVAIAGLLAAPLAQAQTANVTLYGRVNLDMEFVTERPGGLGQHQPEHLPGQLELVALRPSWHRVARWRPECDLPDRERLDQHDDTGGGNLAGRDSLRRPERWLGHVQDGPLPAPRTTTSTASSATTPRTRRRCCRPRRVWAQGFAGQPADRRLRRSAAEIDPLRHAELCRASRAAAQFATNEGTPASNSNNQSYTRVHDNGPFTGLVAYELHHNIRGAASMSELSTTDRRSRSPPSGSSRVQHRRRVRKDELRRAERAGRERASSATSGA